MESAGLNHTERNEATTWLEESKAGDAQATDRLMPLVYAELRRLAHDKLKYERDHHTLNTTGLVHEAYLRLINHKQVGWQSRAHFMATAAKVMRHILIDYAVKRDTIKRGGQIQKVAIEELHEIIDDERAGHLLALDEALERLSAFDPRGAQIVEYRFFAGLTQKETAEVLGMSERSVRRSWFMAKTWIQRELNEAS